MKRLLFVFTMLFCTILANIQNQFEVYGNNREVWCGNNQTTVQRTQYYPSGLPWAEGTGATAQNRKYNGKEFIEMHGYDTYDYGARGYYPAIMMFTTVDPLAESYYSQSPYHFSGNNPIKFVDLNGMNYDDYKLKQDGSIEFVKKTNSKTDDLYATKFDGSIDKNKSVSVSKGSFDKEIDIAPIGESGGGCTRKKVIGEGEGYQMSNSDAAKVFNFASDNSAVEFGLINTKHNGSVVLTNHMENKIKTSITAKKMDKEGKIIIEITHSHPHNSDPSEPDKTNVGKFLKSHGQNVGYNVYQPGNKMVVGYDENGVIFRMESSLFFGN